ncbi:TonB-dependent receptor-like protein [Edaphobacter aggregans]|uniref:TonB-dependent receptor-like protein n=1 Tax=Edaphobacter aggregans TaxID=570835 RepID=A0A428MLY7_9BACT|nr:carboxypeptidase regulatory-like domain-containing protein [Edaphobacter aggregans]RSL17927.1 TonB-dependent receptor-like protein [Edaphobacter aggregans]
MTIFRQLMGRATGFVVAVILVMASGVAQGQVGLGSISGTVTDATGAAVNGATVTLLNTDRNEVVRTVQTAGTGFYTATSLPLGGYTITVTASGFGDQVFSNVILHVGDALTINSTLKAGATEKVVVTTEAQSLNFENATQASLINGTQVRELVLSSRNYEQLVGLQPGVAYTGADQIYIGNSSPNGATNVVNFSVNGSRTSGNGWTVDGVDNQDRGSNYTLLTYPSVDAIAEFKTQRGAYSAEYGRAASGQINVITKSGTNNFHGSAYEFVRNDVFNANDVLNKLTTTPSGAAKTTASRGALRYNDFGYTIGGPVWLPRIYDGRKHNTYFFFSQEIRRVITYKPLTLTGVPSVAERQGIFTKAVCASTNATTGKCNNTGVTTVPITSTLAQAYLKDIYASVGTPDATGTLVTPPQRNLFNGNQQIVRIDQQLGQKMNLFFRMVNDSIPTQEPGGLFQGSGFPGVNTTNTNAPGRTYLGHATYVINPTLLIDGGYAFSYGALLSDPVGLMANANSPDIKPTLLFPSTLPRVPTLTFSSGTTLATYGPYRDFNRNHNIFGNVTKTIANHTLKAGIDYNRYNKRENNASANAGSFGFTNGNLPTGSTAQAYQQAWANFLTGFATTFSQASIDVTANILANQFEVYAQDDWKVTPRLTLNMGVRYTRFAQPTDQNNQLTTFDPSLYSSAAAPTVDKNGLICVTGAPCTGVSPVTGVTLASAVTNGVSINGKNSPYGNKIGSSDNLNFAPRLGFALDVFGNGKTSLRGGYGIAFDSALFGTYEQNIFQNPPFVNSPTVSNTSFDNPGIVAANVSYAAQVIRATAPRFRTPYNQQFSLSFQQQIKGGFVGEVAYVGSVQNHLLGLVDINQAPVGAFAAANPTTTVTSSNVSLINPYRPYKGFSAINSVQTIFMGNYNSLQASARKEWKHNSLVAANYTWSHALTNANADRTGAPQISSLPSAEYGPAAADRRHMFNLNAVYALPFFYEQHGLVGHLLGGWEVSGLGYFNTGLPLNVTTTGLDPAGVGVVFGSSVSSGRPDQIANPNHAGATPIHNRLNWFNINGFSAVPSGQIRGGNAERNVVQGPGWWRVDTGLFKNVNFGEHVHMQLRGEAFNLFNHTNPDTISTGSLISASGFSSTAGNITGYRDKRILQLGAKVIF